MFSLELYMRNSLSSTLVQYTIQNLYFEDFYIGRKRDEKNLLIVRKYTEGTILIKNPADFDSIKDYIYTPQDAKFSITEDLTTTVYEATVNFSEPNFTRKTIKLSLNIIDQYSKILDGVEFDSQESRQDKTISTKYSDNSFSPTIEKYFVDGSQYMYDTQPPGSEFWGFDTITIDVEMDVYSADIRKFDTGGTGEDGNELKIDYFLPKSGYIAAGYKPIFIKWYDYYVFLSTGFYFQNVLVTYQREFRYYQESEDVPEDWEIELPNVTRIFNGKTYYKYYREYRKDQTFLNDQQVYFIRIEIDSGDLENSYATATFAPYDTTLQKTNRFFNLNDLLQALSIKASNFNINSYNSDIPSDYYTTLIKRYNGDYQENLVFELQSYVDWLREIHRIYMQIEDKEISFIYPNFNTKRLDIEDYLNKDNYPDRLVNLNQVPKIINFNTEDVTLDFRSQELSFFGRNEQTEDKQLSIITDPENTSKEGYIIIKTKEENQDQIYERGIYVGEQNGTEAVFRSADGKYISWDTDNLDLATFIEFDLYSNLINLDIDEACVLSYDWVVYSGNIQVIFGDYNVTHTPGNGSVNRNINASGDERLRIISGQQSSAAGFIANLKLKVKTKIPETETGIISGLSKKNGELSPANLIVNKKPFVSFKKTYLNEYGKIDCNAGFYKQISDLVIPLNEKIFDWDFNEYLALDNEKYIIFEEKRQILTSTEISKHSKITAKSNEIY